jgi:hypothetical protein
MGRAMSADRIVDRSLVRRLVVAFAMALAVVPVRGGPAQAQAAPTVNGPGYGAARQSEQPPDLKVTSTPPRPSTPLSAEQRVLRDERLRNNAIELKRAKEAAEKASQDSRGGPSESPSLERALSAARAASAAPPASTPKASHEGALVEPARGAQGDIGVAGVPVTVLSSLGQSDNFEHSDAAIAVGPDRYIQLINSKFAIYAYSSGAPIAQGTLGEFINFPGHTPLNPQIIWDADTNRFYFAVALDTPFDSNLAFGFSKTASPTSAADFCGYILETNRLPPVTARLGDTLNRLLIASEGFDGTFQGTNIIHITKPPAGSTCPDQASFGVGEFTDVRAADGLRASSLVVANQIDGSTTGYAASAFTTVQPNTATGLTLYKLEEAGTTMTMWLARLTVPPYAIPADAKQPVTMNRLATGLGGLTQAVSAIDPVRGGVVGLWTQHTIAAGAGAAVRWYEIDAATPSLLQHDNIIAPNTYLFNAAISPDRVAIGETRRFGGNMVLGMNASSADLRPSIITASKVGDGPIGFRFVAQSGLVLEGLGCFALFGICRWGSYAGASPAPIDVPSWKQGLVVHTTNYVRIVGAPGTAGWGTVNMFVFPQ